MHRKDKHVHREKQIDIQFVTRQEIVDLEHERLNDVKTECNSWLHGVLGKRILGMRSSTNIKQKKGEERRKKQARCTGLKRDKTREGKSDGLQPNSDGLQPKKQKGSKKDEKKDRTTHIKPQIKHIVSIL